MADGANGQSRRLRQIYQRRPQPPLTRSASRESEEVLEHLDQDEDITIFVIYKMV